MEVTAFKFFVSRDVDLFVKVFVGCLEVAHLDARTAAQAADLYWTAQLTAGGLALHSGPAHSRLPALSDDAAYWDQWLTLPVKYRDLPKNAQLELRLWGVGHELLGGMAVQLFDSKLCLKRGLLKAQVFPSAALRASAATGLALGFNWLSPQPHQRACSAVAQERLRLLRLHQQFAAGQLRPVAWLDPLVHRQLEAFRYLADDSDVAPTVSLYLEFPYFEHPVLFEESFPQFAGPQPAIGGGMTIANDYLVLNDPEEGKENPVAAKYARLARQGVREVVDIHLKQNKEERKRIEEIIRSPSLQPVGQDADLLWKFRYSLTANKKALTKFLLSVMWENEEETKQALELLQKWARIDVDDALKLLSPEFAHPAVRKYAVDVLGEMSNEELSCYLLQLVQALRFEVQGESTSPLASMLIRRASNNVQLATYLHWFLLVEVQDGAPGSDICSKVHSLLTSTLEHGSAESRRISRVLSAQAELNQILQDAAKDATGKRSRSIQLKIDKLNASLSRSGKYGSRLVFEEPVPLPVNPTKRAIGIVPNKCHVFKSAMYPVVVHFYLTHDSILPVQSSPALSRYSASPVPSLASGSSAPVPPPPSSVAGSSTHTHTSAGTTAGTTSSDVAPHPTYAIMMKMGDDLRQDQLMLQMIRLMDFQLKKLQLDLKLTLYSVLATGPRSGMVEMVPNSKAVSEVLAAHPRGGILEYFREAHPDSEAEFGVAPHVLDTYVKSCAGYCVFTYLLGIGDRHLDNVMLQSDGHLFHIDFGFIFGRDPKPSPPPMKLTKQMIDAMGGWDSRHSDAFRSFAWQAFQRLRQSASLLLNLLSLMKGCSIQDLRTDADTTISKMQGRFRLDLSDEEAERYLLGLLEESRSALMPVLMERFHQFAAYLK